MSLINDALKRAGTIRALPAEHQGGAPMQPAEEPSARPSGNPMTYGVAGLVALLVIVVAGLLLKSKTSNFEESPIALASTAAEATPQATRPIEAATLADPSPAQPVQITTEAVSLAAALPQAAQPSESALPAKPEPEIQAQVAAPAEAEPNIVQFAAAAPVDPIANRTQAAAIEPALAAPAPVVREPASAPAEPAVAPAPEYAPLQLQAIYYRLRNPSVRMNGKVVRIGETVEGARVTAIHRYGVEVVGQGGKKFLALD